MENSNNIQLVISKSAVVKKDFSKCKVVLQNLLLTRKSVISGKGKLTLRLRGYSTDKRKPHEIPEVVEYIKELDRMFSYWFFFCKPTDAGLQLLSCTVRTFHIISKNLKLRAPRFRPGFYQSNLYNFNYKFGLREVP